MEAILGVAIGIIVGSFIGWLAAKLRAGAKVSSLETEAARAEERVANSIQINTDLGKQLEEYRNQAADNASENAALKAQLDSANKRLSEQADIEKTLADRFKSMASEAVTNNNDIFLSTANEKIATLVRPLSDELKRIEENRNQSQGSLRQQIETLANNNKALERETRNLSTALRAPQVRGRWGEMHLRRVVELAGMTEYCDFEEQVNVTLENGNRDRPDMVVRMPSKRTIVIDAKTPMNAYLTAIESQTEDERDSAISRHSEQVKERALGLAKKAYWQSFDQTPEFVVMFLPGEFLLQPALERDPELIERAMRNRVIIATPNTLMALLKTVEMGWREVQIATEAAEIASLGKELHDRMYTFANHMSSMRRTLSSTVDNFNKGVGSLEHNILPSTRKFKEHGISSAREIAEIKMINTPIRQLSPRSNQNNTE